jgi:double-stranded uracil-DNA glycosylase
LTHVHSFSPIESATSRILILGTMPGKVSLEKQQYYAHPRNLFWKMVGGVLGFDPLASYEARVAALVRSDVALWDVLRACTRETSLDSDIDNETLVPNDFASFLAVHQRVRTIFFNGTKAESLFRRHVVGSLPASPGVRLVRLPSTSPANGGIPMSEKVRAWGGIGAI